MFKFCILLFCLTSIQPLTCDPLLCNCLNSTCQSCLTTFMHVTNNTCQPCPSQCSSCTSSLNCNGCQLHFYASSGTCQLCSQFCEICNPVCSKCMNGYALKGANCVACASANTLTCDSGGLVLSCKEGFWQNGNSCSPCRQFCLVCSSPSNCLQCQQGYFVAVSFGSYCQMCSSGCKICSANGCSQCFYNYQLVGSACVDISGNCSGIANCRYCVVGGGTVQCHACVFPYYIVNGSCVYGASLLCRNGATGPNYWQCIDSCAPFGYVDQNVGNNIVCLPLPWLGSIEQVFINSFDAAFVGKLVQTSSSQTIYFDENMNLNRAGSSLFSFEVVLSPYYKTVIQLKLLTNAVAIGSTLSTSLILTDNSSNTEQYNTSHQISANSQVVYLSVNSKTIKDRKVNITVLSSINSNATAVPVVGLSEALIQVYPCPANCVMCYNAELCIQCDVQYFNTPQYLCVAQCIGYLQLYLPSGNIQNYTQKQCVLTCPSSFYPQQMNSTYRCQKCSGLCLTCLSQTQCLSCRASYIYYEINFECLTVCPPTHYNISGVCTLCSAPCATCLNISYCLTCSIGYYSNGSCTSSCPLGTYANTSFGICDSCDPKCASCKGSSTFCSACVQPYLLFQSTCVSSCPSGLYFQNNLTCQACSSPCLLCTNATSCISCLLGYLQNTTCVSTCSSGLFADALTSSCKNCANGCQTCQSETICSSCPNNTHLYSFQCLSACPQGTYSSGGICLDCIQPCSSCLNQTFCQSCGVGYLSSVSMGSCVTVCQVGYYAFIANSTCQKCNAECASCSSSASTCTSCASSLLLQGNTCIASCNPGFYNYSNSCLGCSFPCKSCTNNDFTCLSCQLSFILVNNTCVSECPQFSYFNGTGCSQCQWPCATCSSASVCLSCGSNSTHTTYFNNGNCVSSCGQGYFAENGTLSCRACSYPCQNCLSDTICTSCLNGYLNPFSFSCQICSGVYFTNTTSQQCQLCSSVLSNCSQCISEFECIFCYNSTYLLNGSCISLVQCETLVNFYADVALTRCVSCVSPCLDCTNASFCLSCQSGILHQGSCLTACPEGYYTHLSSCNVCSPLCLTCSNATACLTCNSSGLFPILFSQQSTCISQSSCGSGYFIDTSFGWSICTKCVNPCSTCMNATYCTSCISGLILDGTCKSMCPSGYFADSGNSSIALCRPCDVSCFKCVVSAANCSACLSSQYLKKGSCVTACGDGYYLDSYIYQCFACVSPCLTCSSASLCLSCLNSSYLLHQSKCISSCPGGTYQLNGSCRTCNISCLTCTYINNSVQCLQCANGLFMSMAVSGQCDSSCSSSQYGDNITHNCYSCMTPCVTCSTAISCLSCVANYLLVGNQCLFISRCPSGLFLLGRECLASCGSLWAVEATATCQSICNPPALKLIHSSSHMQCLSGCPANFRVDSNYSCTFCYGNTCDNLLRVTVQVKSIFNVLYAKLAFSKQVGLQGITNTSLQLSLTSVGARLLVGQSVNYSVVVVNLDAIWLQLDVTSSVRNARFSVTFADFYVLAEPLQTLTYETQVQSFDLYTKEEEQKGKNFEIYSEIMSGIMLALFGLDLILNSGHLSYLVIDYYQFLFMILFLSIDYPPPLNHFLYGFRYSHYLFLPQIFKGDPSGEYSSATPDKFGVIVPDVQFLNNAGPAFIVISTAIGILILTKLLQLVAQKIHNCRNNKVVDEQHFEQKQGKCSILLKSIVSRFKWNYFNDVIYNVYFSLMLFAFSQLYDLTWRTGTITENVSIILAFLFIIVGIIFPLWLGYFLHKQKNNLIEKSLEREKEDMIEKKDQKKEQMDVNLNRSSKSKSESQSGKSENEQESIKYYQILTQFKCFLSGVKLRVKIGFYNIPIKYIKKLIFAALIVFCSEYPSFVLGVTMMACLINMLVAIVIKPYRLTFQQVLFPIFDGLYLLVFLTICIMQLSQLSLNQEQKLNAAYLAIAICIILSLLLVVHNIVINVVEVIKFCCNIDYLRAYYQTEYVCTTENEEPMDEEVSRGPLQKQTQKEGTESGSMISGLDIYLNKDETAPKYLIKCIKPDQEEPELKMAKDHSSSEDSSLRVGDIVVSQKEGKSNVESQSEVQEKGEQIENIFADLKAIQISDQNQND